MFVFFFASILAVEYVGVDLGSQFTKIATSTTDGQAVIYVDKVTNKVNVPSAAAIKLGNKEMVPPFNQSDFKNIDVRTGRRAIPILKKNHSLGYEFLPRVMGRESVPDDFNTSKLANVTELLSLFCYNLFSTIGKFNTVAFSIPFFWNRRQTHILGDALRFYGLPVETMLDDITSITLLYSSLRLSRFMNKIEGHHVLFIDVGATKAEAYTIRFTYDHNTEQTTAEQTSVGWNEKVGGYFFAKQINPSNPSKGFKKINTNSNPDFKFDTKELVEMIKKVIFEAEGKYPIDEVQLIGGASQHPFVTNAIKELTDLPLRRDFNSNEAIALGTVIGLEMLHEASPYPNVNIRKYHTSDVSIKCGNQTEKICTYGQDCGEIIAFSQWVGCEEMEIVMNETYIPEGSGTVLQSYVLKNITDFNLTVEANQSGIIQLDNLQITSIASCGQYGCEPVDFEFKLPNYEYLDQAKAFLEFSQQAEEIKTIRVVLFSRIDTILSKLTNLIEKAKDMRVETIHPVTDDMRQKVAEVAKLQEDGLLEQMNIDQLNQTHSDLKDIATNLGININI